MNCLDCLSDSAGYWSHGKEQPAVAICTRCGAGVCRRHAVVAAAPLTVTMPIARTIPVDPPARRVLCRQCDAAETAQSQASTGPTS